jgi:hypothetical protein
LDPAIVDVFPETEAAVLVVLIAGLEPAATAEFTAFLRVTAIGIEAGANAA